MTRMKAAALPLIILAVSLLIVLFAPSSVLKVAGFLLTGLSLGCLVLSGTCFSPSGWQVREEDSPSGLLFARQFSLCIDGDLLKDVPRTEGDLILTGGTYPVSRIRSLPGGALLSAALATTWEECPNPKTVSSLFSDMNIDPVQFSRQFPFLRTLHLSSVSGRVVQDGNGERVFFNMESSSPDSIRFLQHCRLIQDGVKIRDMQDSEKRELPDLPPHTLLLFTGVPKGNQVDRLTFLGALSLRNVQRLRRDVLSDIRELEADGHEVFLEYPLQAAPDIALQEAPIPVHAADAHAVFLHRIPECTDAVSLREAGKQALLFRCCRKRAFLIYACFALAASVLLSFTTVHAAFMLPFLMLPLLAPLVFHSHSLPSPSPFPAPRHIVYIGIVYLLDALLILLPAFLIGMHLWQQSLILHLLVLSLASGILFLLFWAPSLFPSLLFTLMYMLCTLALAAGGYFFCGLEGTFAVLLGALCGLLLLLSGSQRS